MQWHKGEALRLSFFQLLIFLWCFMDNNNRVPLILFSGGLDSTYLLQTKLAQGDVEVLYVKGVLHHNKMKMEKKRRTKIIEILEKQTGNKVRREHTIDLGIMPFGNMEDQSFTQPPMWIMGALMVSDSRKHSELLIGYVSGDQIMPQLSHIQAAWEQLQYVSKMHDNVRVDFPLRFDTKHHILERINPEIMRQVWWCETPDMKYHFPKPERKSHLVETQEEREAWYASTQGTIRPCGRCEACHRMATTFFAWKRKTKVPYWKHLLRELRRQKLMKGPEQAVELVMAEPAELIEVDTPS
jgi:7-cyano-7-deazaguanine synthase in queuosine biosynthesis